MSKFDELSKAVAQAQTRREAIGVVVGALLAAIGVGRAWGQDGGPSACQEYCAQFYPPPRKGNAQSNFGQCVSGCNSCVQSGGIACGPAGNCCDPDEEICADDGTCVDRTPCRPENDTCESDDECCSGLYCDQVLNMCLLIT